MSQSESPTTDSQISTDDQAGLAQFDYDQYERETPDEYVRQVTEQDDIFSLEKGDQVWIDGTTYTVIANAMHLLSPPPKYVVGEDGSQHELIAGKIPGEDVEGVTWRSRVSDKKSHEITRSALVSQYENVYITHDGDDLEHFHEVIPNSPHQCCPKCSDSEDVSPGGTVKHTEIQGNTAIEVRVCSNTDCKHIYRYTQPIDEDSTATVLLRDHENKQYELEQIQGFYEVEDQDDFKFPVETHDGIHDGYRRAEDIAAFVNKKMVTEGINSLLQADQFTPSDLLNLLSFTKEVRKAGLTSEVDLDDWGEILTLHFENDSDVDATTQIASQLSEDTPEEFASVLYAIHSTKQTLPDPDDKNQSTLEAPVGDHTPPITNTDLDVLAQAIDQDTTPDPQNDIQSRLLEAFNQDLSGQDLLTSTVFYELLTRISDTTVFGKVCYDTGRFDSISKAEANLAWVDDINSYEQMMQVTYSEFERFTQEPFSVGFKWQIEEYNLADLILG